MSKGDDDEVGGKSRFQSTANRVEAEGHGPVLGDRIQQPVVGEIGVQAVEEPGFRENVEIGIRSEAIGAEADADTAAGELAEGVRRMIEGRVGARANDEGDIRSEFGSEFGIEVVAVDDQSAFGGPDSLKYFGWRMHQPRFIPGVQPLQKIDERPGAMFQQFEFPRRFGQMNGGEAANIEEFRPATVRRMRADAGSVGRAVPDLGS